MPKLCLNMIVKNEGSITHPVLKYLTPHPVRLKERGPYDSDKIRIGGDADGGYVMLNDFEQLDGVLSYGVGTVEVAGKDCISFDYDLALRGLPVVLLDHTVDTLPQWHPNFVFVKEGVGSKDKRKTKTIKTHLKQLTKGGDRLILKMDVEGAEYDAINATSPATLRKFRQIIIELHDLTRLDDPRRRSQILETLERLDRDFILHHVHGNNTAKVATIDGLKVIDVLELSYARKDTVDPAPALESFPTAFDRPCWPAFPDVKLDFYPFEQPKAKIIRCLESVAPYIDNWVIYDTGSTDDTIPLIEGFFKASEIPGYVVKGKFVNFEQARNDALRAARQSPYDWEYLLLADADMELVVEDRAAFEKLNGASHSLIQRNGGMSYGNIRFIRRGETGAYIGVTHEYLNIPDAGLIEGIWYKDHCDGANRPDKYSRDIRLLETALKADPNNGRYLYYLASTYSDASYFQKAEEAYLKRINLGGWAEETWSAIYKRAHCFRSMGKEAEFVKELLSAYNFRPCRAEPLYDLAKFYREKGMNYAALLVLEEGLKIPPTGDMLFVQDYCYHPGMQEEFSIAAFYDPKRQDRGFDITNFLSLDPKGTSGSRDLARSNLFHYMKPLCTHIPSFQTRRIPFTPPDPMYIAMNPCITRYGPDLTCLVRTVNYTMDEHGRYLIRATNGEANGSNPISTRNYLVRLENNFEVARYLEVLPPEGFPPPVYPLVVGCEDMRIFEWRNDLWSISNIREQNAEGWCEQYMARVLPSDNPGFTHLDTGRFLRPAHRQHEKNWMPFVSQPTGELRFVYRPGEFIYPSLESVKHETVYDAAHVSGGSQMIPFMGGYIGVVHEARPHPHTGKRWYQHRFMYIDLGGEKPFTRLSLPFVFHDRVIEFAAGICWHPDEKRVLISYGREDKEAWIASVDAFELAEFVNA